MTAPLRIGSTKQLFLDDLIVERRDGVERQFHRPVRHDGNPFVEADKSWEGRTGVYLFGGTVLYDDEERIFKMWYRTAEPMVKAAHGELPETSGAYSFEDVPGYIHPEGAYRACYAVSSDGLSWEKPDLGLVEFEGSKRNNIIPPGVGGGAKGEVRRPNLIKDYEEPDPGRRYKMAYMDEIDGRWALAVGYSADGIRWRMNAVPPSYMDPPHLPHGVLFGWDPRLRKYVIHHRKSGSRRADVDGREVRSELALVASSSPDFESWGDPREIVRAHEHDPPRWDPGGHVGVMAAMLYTQDLYVGVMDTCLTHHVEDVPDELWDTVYRTEHVQHETELIISRDGYDWTRVAPHWWILRAGLPGTWDSGTVGLSKPLVWNDRILFYYSGKNGPDKSENPTHPRFDSTNPYALGVATMRLDGFVSMEGYEAEGTLTTRPFVLEGDRLIVNARAPEKRWGATSAPKTPYGRMRIELLDGSMRPFDGYGQADCDPFTGDDLRHVVTWRGNSDLGPFAGTSVRVKFYLNNAAVYSFQIGGQTAPPGPYPLNLHSPGNRGHAQS